MNSSLTTNTQLIRLSKKLGIRLNNIVSKDHLYDMTPSANGGGYIINMEDSKDGNGSHWVAIWFDPQHKKSIPLYFDSFGIEPPIAVMDFMKKWNNKCIFSTKEIQNINSGFCGQYCVYFLYDIQNNSEIPLKKRYNLFLSNFH